MKQVIVSNFSLGDLNRTDNIREFLMVTVDELYRCYNILLEAKDEAPKYLNEYMTILKGASGETSSKMLTLQFLPKFSKYFPNLLSQAFEYQLDLCEDNDINIRRQSVKYLLEYADIDEKLRLKVADILIQLCCVDDAVVCDCAQKSIDKLIKQYPLKVASALITYIEEAEENCVLIALDILSKILGQLPALKSSSNNSLVEDEITKFISRLNEAITKCFTTIQTNCLSEKPESITYYNNLMISILILMNPSSFKLTTPSDFIQKIISSMSIVVDHIVVVDHMLDLLKLYKLAEPYFLADHNLVGTFVLNFVHKKLYPILPSLEVNLKLDGTSDYFMFKVLYLIMIREIVILYTYLPLSITNRCVSSFLTLLMNQLPETEKFNPQTNSYSDDTTVDCDGLGCFMLGFYYILYKNPSVSSSDTKMFEELRSRLSILLRVLNSGSLKSSQGSLNSITVGKQPSIEVSSTTTTSKHPLITPPSSPAKATYVDSIGKAKNRFLIANRHSSEPYKPPYLRESKKITTSNSNDTINQIKLISQALILNPISRNVPLTPYWKSDKLNYIIKNGIAKCITNLSSCKKTTCSTLFHLINNGNSSSELPKTISPLQQIRSVSSFPSDIRTFSASFSLKRNLKSKRTTEKPLSSQDSMLKTQLAQKRQSKVTRGRGRRR